MSFVLTFVAMFGFWMLLSGELAPILVLSGVVSSLIVARMSHDLLFGGMDLIGGIVWVWRIVKYIPWLIWQIIIANFDIVYRTLHPSMPIDPEMFEVEAGLDTDLGLTIFAQSITLTPGTVTVEARREGFLVHSLTRGADVDPIRDRVKALEARR